MNRDELAEHCKWQAGYWKEVRKRREAEGRTLNPGDKAILEEHQLVLDILEELRVTRAAFKKYVLDMAKICLPGRVTSEACEKAADAVIARYMGENNRPQFYSAHSHNVKGRGEIHMCEWPEDVEPTNLCGKEIYLDGNLCEVSDVEYQGSIRKGGVVGLIVRPVSKTPS